MVGESRGEGWGGSGTEGGVRWSMGPELAAPLRLKGASEVSTGVTGGDLVSKPSCGCVWEQLGEEWAVLLGRAHGRCSGWAEGGERSL